MFATGGKIYGRFLRVALSRYGRRNAWPESEKTRLTGRVSRKIRIVLVEKTIHLFAFPGKGLRRPIPAGDALTFSLSLSRVLRSGICAACDMSGLKRPGGSTAP